MRKLFVYICFMLLLGSNAKAYFGGNSAYGIYQLASSGNIRAMQSAIDNGSSLDAEDGNGQSPICYAIRNSDYVAYKNLVLLRADEHPSCVNRISKQEYESFKKGYEIRGGKIASSFSLGKAGMWTLAGIGTAGAAVGIAAAAGGGGGGGGSSSGGSDTPTPPPTPPTPSEPCASYDLIYCVDHGVCDECIGSRPYYKLTGCQEGYVLNTKKTGCLVDTEIRTEYPLEECDKNGTCASAKSGEDTVYKLLDCNDGYKLSSDKMSCVKICLGYTQEACPKSAQYLSETCSEDNSYHICTNRTNVVGCNDFSLNEDRCTSCRDGYKLINGECKPKCQGYTQVSCDNQTQYIKEKCTDDETYHKCASRNHSEGCDILATDSDTCLLCKEGFKLNNSNICEKLCDGYTRISCDRSQYISDYCADDASYHKCEDRKKSTTGCMDVSLTEDACQTCYDGYKLVDGVCNEICAGYTNLPCNNTLEYIKETCSENNLYHKCQNRLNIEGCSNFDTHADKCTSCDKGYELSTDGKCTQVECLGYKSAACDKPTEYISETCTDNPLFHKCKQRTNVTGCSDFKLNSDTCISCISGYSINNGICEFSCPGYTNVACNNNTQYRSSTCLKDNTYHICTWRTNTVGCATFSETSDTCTSCLQGYSLKSGRCEFDCPTMYEDECDFYTQYISEVCPTAPTYHVCTERKNTEYCTDYETYKDECTACEDEYMVKNGKCTHICHGYKKEECSPIETYYAVSDCTDPGGDEYHKCVERTNFTGCKRFSPSSDNCLECESGYTLQEGKCNDNATLCKGYVNTDCINETQYIGETCPYDQSYHKCPVRTKSTIGCKTLNPNADECSVCENGYMLGTGTKAGECVEKCPASSGYKKDCDTNTYILGAACANDSEYHICTQVRTKIAECTSYVVNDDKCAECSSGYILSEDGKACNEKCPSSEGYKKEACGDQYYISKKCDNDKTYHICTQRTKSTDGCQTLDLEADKCSACKSTYMPDTEDSAICVEKCPAKDNYKQSCNQSVEFIEKTCVNDPTYLKCKTRTHVVGCSSFAPDADKCLDCKTGYHLDATNTYCVADAAVCPGYGKGLSCNNATQWTESCYDDPTYKKCNDRKKSRKADGCETPAPSSDTCQECKTGYELNEQNLCDPVTAICVGYQQDACDKTQYISATCEDDTSYHQCTTRTHYEGCDGLALDADKCLSCKSGYHMDSTNTYCVINTAVCPGYAQSCDRIQYLDKTQACADDPSYYKCVTRNNLDGCKDLALDADKCLSCETGYHISGNKCAKDEEEVPCPTGYDRADHNINEQYQKAYDYNSGCAWWVDRTKVNNCKKYVKKENKCEECYSDYTLSEDGLTCSSETPIPSSDTLCRINDCSSYPLDTCPDNAVCECCEDGSSHYKFTGCMEGATLTGENTCSAPGSQTKTNFNVNNTVDTIVVTNDNINNYSFTKDANKYTVGFPNVSGVDFDEDKDIYNAQNQNGSIEINALTEQTSFNRIFGITTPETIDKYVTYTVPTHKDTSIFNAYSDGGNSADEITGSISLATGIGILAPGNVYNAFTLHDPGTTTTSFDGESTKIAANGYINVSSDGYGIYSYGSVYNAYGLGSYAYTSVGSTDTKTAFGIYAPRIINAYDGGRGVVAVTKDFPRQGVSAYAVGMEGDVIYNAFNDSDKANLKISDKEYGAYGAVYVGNLNGIGMRGNEVHNAYGYKTYGLISSTATTQYFASANFTGIKSTSGFITNGAKGGTGEILIDIGNTNYEGQVHQTAVGIDNQLQSFNEDINAYNGYDSLSSGLIKISGGGYGWMSTNIITGAINTHNGSPTGGIGEIRIVNNNTAINSWSHIVGLSGGNNYENSLINIVANNLDRRSTDFLPFVVGMIKEVGAYRYYDYNTDIQLVETGEIPLLFTSNSFNSSGLFNKGKIMLTNNNEGSVYGMVGLRHHYSANAANLGDIVNDTTGSIKITATAATESYGILVNNLMTVSDFNIERATKKANIINAGKIEINGGAYVYGIYGINSNITNTGNINIETVYNNEYGYHATYGIYADNSEVANTGNITIDTYGRTDKVAGIYAVNGSKVYNGGTITINGESYNKNIADGKFIYIDSSSSIINTSSLVSTTSINTEDLGGGSIVMMSGSNITAPEVSGNLILGADITQGSNNDIYVTPNLVTGDTQNLSVSSQSAMFSASINNDNSTTDGVLTRNSFNSLIDDSSIADYLEHNYTAGNASDLFNKLKQAESLSQLNRNISDLFGQKMLARMTFEDMSMLREINLDMNDNMFKEEGAFALSGTVSPSSYANNVGSIGRYALNGFNHGKTSYALGISISDVSTYDDDKENSRSDRSFVMSAPIGYKTRGFELITSPKIGYAYGEYNRNGLDGTYNGKVYKRMYALMNEARYPLNWGKMKFTPSAEFNMIGFNVKGSEDNQKPYYLRIKPQRHYSVETGIGLTAEKEFSLYKLHNFKINGGLAFYHEFANPYELDVSMSEMDGTYRLHDEKRHDNRTVVRFGFDYELGEDVDVSASLLSNIDGEYRTDAACDIKYHF